MKTESIKLPDYAIVLGKGKFAGNAIYWQCRKCGKYIAQPSKPSPMYLGRCPSTPTGNHMWVKA